MRWGVGRPNPKLCSTFVLLNKPVHHYEYKIALWRFLQYVVRLLNLDLHVLFPVLLLDRFPTLLQAWLRFGLTVLGSKDWGIV